MSEEGKRLAEAAARFFLEQRRRDHRGRGALAIELWKAQSEAHRTEMNRIETLWAELGLLQDIDRPSLAEVRQERRERGSGPLRKLRASLRAVALRLRVRIARLPPPAVARKVAIVAIVALAGTAVFYRGSEDAPPLEVRTAVGENRITVLADGSEIVAGADTLLTVTYSDNRRGVALVRGEALFTVAPDPLRPFVVDTGLGRVVAVGTAFNVRRTRETVTVTVVEGVVQIVAQASAPTGATRTSGTLPDGVTASVGAGGQIVLGDRIERRTLARVQVKDTVAWRIGKLVFHDEPLSVVVEDINRYSPVKLRLADPALGDLRISGRLHYSEVLDWIEGLGEVFGLDVDQIDRGTVLIRRRL